MKLSHLLAAAILVVVSSRGHASTEAPPLLTSGINVVQFGDDAEQPFLGSGFVIEYQGRLFGVTAKHVLLMRSGGAPTSTDIQDQLHHWHLRDPRSKATLAFGPLLTGDASEPVDLARIFHKPRLAAQAPPDESYSAAGRADLRAFRQSLGPLEGAITRFFWGVTGR